MHPDVEELRPKLKEILYDCAVDIRATKAALYLFDGTSRFELVTEYGFRGGLRDVADAHDPVADRCGRGRTPFYINGVGTEPRFSQLLFDAATDRILAAPMYSRGKLVGFVDMRDKAGKVPFSNEDVPKAQKIADRLTDVFADRNVFGHRFITLSAADEEVTRAETITSSLHEPSPMIVTAAAPRPEVVEVRPASRAVPMATIAIEARAAASRVALIPPETISDGEVAAIADVLRGVLLLPGAVAAVFTAFGHMGGVREIAARSTLHPEARNLIESKLNAWLSKRGEEGGAVQTTVTTPLGISTPPIAVASVQKVFTAPIHVREIKGLFLSAVFSNAPERTTHELLAVLHAHLHLAIEQSLQRTTSAASRRKIAGQVVEPQFSKFPELRRHSELVARLCDGFARSLALAESEREDLVLAAMVHDCGMRLLDYARLYRKRELSVEERSFLREHPLVGAAIVEPLLGANVARIVLTHHERADGRGYPEGLQGEDVPFLARVLQLCDAWVAMTDPETYQAPEPRESALTTIAQAAGTQFDAALAMKFVQMMRKD